MDLNERQGRLDRYWGGQDEGVSLQLRLLQWEQPPAPISSTPNKKQTHSANPYCMSTTISSEDSTNSSQSGKRSNAPTRTHSGSSMSTVSDTPYDCGYDLPCEFVYLDCPAQYHGMEIKLWIAHSHSHFENFLPPRKAVCIFCDASFESLSQTLEDIKATWLKRMMHISGHYQSLKPIDISRPDFHVIDHLWKSGKISQEVHEHLNNYSERPAHFNHDDLVPLNVKRPQSEKMKEQKREEQKNRRSREAQNLAKEERLLKRQEKMRKT